MKAHLIILSSVIICFILGCKKDEPSEIILNDPPIPNFEIDNNCEPVGDGIAYEVGPGKDYENITDVPFEDLNPGDVVKIHARTTPYYERILITTAKGTADAPICICGVADDNGNLPILDGTNARVRNLEGMNDYFYDVTAYLGMIVICNRYENHPEYIHITNLQIQGAHQYLRDESQKCYVMGSNELRAYGDGAAGIWMRGKHIKVSNCIIQQNGNGIFGAFNSDADPLVDVKLYGNIIRNNGTKDQFLQHNIYIEADGLESIGNQFGPMRDGSPGANYKSRGAGDVIMYNKFVGPAARHFDLVESQNGYGNLSEKESFRYSYVVGNIVEAVSGGAGNILHYGGDGDNTTPSNDLRQGTVYAYNNTFILKGYYLSGDDKGQWRKSFMDLNTCNEKLYAFNNIFTTVNDGPDGASDPQISIFRSRGAVSEFENNIVSDITKSWYNDKTDGDPCSFGLNFTIIENSMQSFSDIAFVDAENSDFKIAANSVAKDAGKKIPDNLIPVKHQFKSPNGIEERKVDGAIDIGAFEY